jgi:hypothetical protein
MLTRLLRDDLLGDLLEISNAPVGFLGHVAL